MNNLSTPITALLLFFLPCSVFAATLPDVVINEIAWMGTEINSADEWIELHNNTNFSINLESWLLKAIDGTPEINLTGIISDKGFYLLERTDDNTLPDISADQIYTGALNNSGEHLQLIDDNSNIIDEIICSDNWFSGDNKTKQTIERIGLNNWQTSQNPRGTPKSENSKLTEDSEKDGEARLHQTHQTSESTLTTYPTNIIINEILPSPEGPDAENEWLELFNKNDFEVDISNWKITDTIGRTKTYIFPEGTKIEKQGFLLLDRPKTKITLNNSSDGLKLFQPNEKIIDEITFEKAPLGQSYNRFESEWKWSSILTPNSVNIISEQESQNKLFQNESQPKKDNNLFIIEKEKFTASLNKELAKSSNSSHILGIALILAISSGIIILFFKKKLKND